MDKSIYSSVLPSLKSCRSNKEVPGWPARGYSPLGRTGPSTAPHAALPMLPSPSSSRLLSLTPARPTQARSCQDPPCPVSEDSLVL